MTKDEALKMALEALEGADQIDCDMQAAITAIKEALAHPEQEPVAWMFQHDETGRMNYVSNDGIHDPTMFLGMNPRYALVCPLYTTPPQRKPQYDKTKMNCFVQDLYDKKIQEGKHGQYEAMFHVVHRAIEAAHGIKE